MKEQQVDVTIGTGLRSESTNGRHVVVCDEPETNGGSDQGMMPVEVFLASLGACTAITLRLYATRKSWPLEGARVKVRLFRPAPGEKGMPRLVQEVHLEGDLDEAQRERLREIAGRCPVHRLVTEPLETEDRLV